MKTLREKLEAVNPGQTDEVLKAIIGHIAEAVDGEKPESKKDKAKEPAAK